MNKNKFFNLNLPDKIFGIEKSFLVLFLAPLGLFLLFLLSLRLILISKINDIYAVNKQIKTIEFDTNKIKQQNSYLMSIDQEELKKNAEYLDNAVLKDKRSYLLVEIIRGVANKFDYQIQSFSLTPGEIKNNESIKIVNSKDAAVRMPIDLSILGPKERSLDLVLALEKTLPILFIDKFEKKDIKDLCQLNLTVSSYYLGSKMNIETSNLNLNDLILSKQELELINKISSFTKIENNSMDVGTSIMFQKYQRDNPFSL